VTDFEHSKGCPEDHAEGTKCLADRKNDGRLDIVITEEAYIFSTGKGQMVDHSMRQIGKGVVSRSAFGMSHIGALYFDRSTWEFEDVRDFLLDLGFRPSELQNTSTELEAPPELHVVEVAFEFDLESVEKVPVTALSLSADQMTVMKLDTGVPLLKVKAKAITAGTHKGFIFTKGVLKKSVPLYNGQNIVLNHKFEDPEDVVGFIPDEGHAEMGEEGPIVEFYVTKTAVMERVESGELHSVSSNFMLTANKGLVQKVNKVMEVTLTGRPADEDATVEDHQRAELQSQNLRPKFGSQILGDYHTNLVAETTNNTTKMLQFDTTSTKGVEDTMSENNKNPEPPAPSVEAATVQQTLEQVSLEKVELEKKIAELEKENEEKDVELNINRDQARLQLASDQAAELYRVKLIYPNQVTIVESLYASFNDDQRKVFHEFMSGFPTIAVDFSDRGTPMTDQPSILHRDQVEELILEDADALWNAYTGERGGRQMPPQHVQYNTTPMQPYPTGVAAPEHQGYPAQFQAPAHQPQQQFQAAPVFAPQPYYAEQQQFQQPQPLQAPPQYQQPQQQAPPQVPFQAPPVPVGYNPAQPNPGGPGPIQAPQGFNQPMPTDGNGSGEPAMPAGIRSFTPDGGGQ